MREQRREGMKESRETGPQHGRAAVDGREAFCLHTQTGLPNKNGTDTAPHGAQKHRVRELCRVWLSRGKVSGCGNRGRSHVRQREALGGDRHGRRCSAAGGPRLRAQRAWMGLCSESLGRCSSRLLLRAPAGQREKPPPLDLLRSLSRPCLSRRPGGGGHQAGDGNESKDDLG